MTPALQERQHEAWRLAVLQVLQRAGLGDVGLPIIRSSLWDLGHQPSREWLAAEARALAEQGLVTAADRGGIVYLTLTPRGADVAEGRLDMPGIRRARPWDDA